jgi:hypothetical protein
MSDNWPKYTITAILGLVVGLVTTFTNETISNTSRIAGLEVMQKRTLEVLDRIEVRLMK